VTKERGKQRLRPRRIVRRIALPVVSVAGLALAAYAVERIGVSRVGNALLSVNIVWAIVALLLMCSAMATRSESWYAVLRAAGAPVRRRDALRGTMIGVLLSAALPGRLGEPARTVVVSRRLGGARRWVATVAGTVFAQTLLNILALALLAAVAVAGTNLVQGHVSAVAVALAVPIGVAGAVVVAPPLFRRLASSRFAIVRNTAQFVAAQIEDVRRGLLVFRRRGPAFHATTAQLSAWALQCLSCYTLLVAFGLQHEAGLDAAAAVLLAVNLSAILPATPSNVGIFQAACVLVLAAYGVGKGAGLAYGIVLQAVEVVTAVLLGVPALLSEGLRWGDIRRSADELAQRGGTE
jgi:phosphatidyl-myo-inositol alpha-mannosyltransferase